MVAVQIKERPILFAGEMVRAIQADLKTQTRRAINRIPKHGQVRQFKASETPGYDYTFRCKRGLWQDYRADDLLKKCPYGQPGDRLWVREAWQVFPKGPLGNWAGVSDDRPQIVSEWNPLHCVCWRADGPLNQDERWRPSIHMPRWASRVLLEITEIRIEQVSEISHEDAIAEGVHRYRDEDCYKIYTPTTSFGTSSPIKSFASLWDSINGVGAFDLGSWTWAVSFKRIAGR